MDPVAVNLRNEILRGAIYSGCEPSEIVRLYYAAPLIELAREIETVEQIERAAEALVEARVVELCDALIEARRDATLGWARAAALEVLA